MNTQAIGFAVLFAVCVSGCGEAGNRIKQRRQTVDLLKSISDVEHHLEADEDSLRYVESLGKSVSLQRIVIESSRKRLLNLRSEIYRHSDVIQPVVDQIRFEELDHQKLQDRLGKITDDHEKGMKRAAPRL
ncbi:MAG: hypothetical protein JSS49_30330 [Planctomycetes bacterium]|nr:hypothetical protein [Planctomycetota bacterium]